MALVYAWRFLRPWFWALLPFVVGLWVSTIYLRHHYFVDLVAGWALAPVAVWLAPRVDAWWADGSARWATSPPVGPDEGATPTAGQEGSGLKLRHPGPHARFKT